MTCKSIVLSLVLAALCVTHARAGDLVTTRDSYCIRDKDGVSIGVVLAGTSVTVLDERADDYLIFSERHGQECWVDKDAFAEVGYLHPEDLKNTMRWLPLVERWMPEFEDTLTPELVLAVIAKETKGNPYAVDATGNDVRLVGAASVGVMGFIPRPHLPCYATLTSANGKDEYPCQIYGGMFVLDSAIRQAHQLNLGLADPLSPPVLYGGELLQDAECTSKPDGGVSVGWLEKGIHIEGVAVVHNGAGAVSYVQVYSMKHGRSCWIEAKFIEHAEIETPTAEQSPIYTQADIELGLQLYNCSLEGVLNNTCSSWGGAAYSDDIIKNILPDIVEAMP